MLDEQCGGTGDVRRCHRRTGHAAVAVAHRLTEDGSGRAGRDDPDTGGGDVGFHGARGSRSLPGEVRERFLAVDRSDGQRGRGGTGRLDRPGTATVARGHDEQRAGGPGQPIDGLLDRIDLVAARAAETEIDDRSVLGHRPLDAGQYGGLGAVAGVVADLAVQQLRVGSDTAIAVDALARDGGRDVRAVAGDVGRRGRREVLGRQHLAGEIRVRAVDAAVEDRDLDALSGVARLPGGRSADLGDAVVERHPQLPVEPDLGLLSLTSEEPGRGVLRNDQRGRGIQLPDRCRVPGSSRLTAHDERDVSSGGVVVPVLEQQVQVEEPLVELPGPDRLPDVGRDHGPVCAGTPALEGDLFAPGGPLDRDLVAVPAAQDHPVTRDQCDNPVFAPGRLVLGGRSLAGRRQGRRAQPHCQPNRQPSSCAHVNPLRSHRFTLGMSGRTAGISSPIPACRGCGVRLVGALTC